MSSTLLKTVSLQNILSFGPEKTELELAKLNVVIGPNGSGKSNLIEAISLLQAAPTVLEAPVRLGGGIHHWLWKGAEETPHAHIEVTACPAPNGSMDLRYAFAFTEIEQRFELVDERLENAQAYDGKQDPYIYYRYQRGHAVLNVESDGKRGLKQVDATSDESIFSQRKEPDEHPVLTWLGKEFKGIRIYREWNFGRRAQLRRPQEAGAPNDFLQEDCSNLGLVLNSLQREPKVKRDILGFLTEFYDGIEDYFVIIEGGTVQLFLQEGDYSIPASRLSDGTIRYLCLLAILCHPRPPALICIEEPELGIHADIMPVIAKLLRQASERTQLIVTTHSDALIDALSDTPEAVVVCEKEDGCTELRRLEKEKLKDWLNTYSLGELWRKGEIGGNRW